ACPKGLLRPLRGQERIDQGTQPRAPPHCHPQQPDPDESYQPPETHRTGLTQGDKRQRSVEGCLHTAGSDDGPGYSIAPGAQPVCLRIWKPEQLRQDKPIAFLQDAFIVATQGKQFRLLLDQGCQGLLLLTQRRFLLIQGFLDPGALRLSYVT